MLTHTCSVGLTLCKQTCTAAPAFERRSQHMIRSQCVLPQGITCEAYGPLGHSKTDLLAHPEVTAVAKEVDRSPAQVCCCSLMALASRTAH